MSREQASTALLSRMVLSPEEHRIRGYNKPFQNRLDYRISMHLTASIFWIVILICIGAPLPDMAQDRSFEVSEHFGGIGQDVDFERIGPFGGQHPGDRSRSVRSLVGRDVP